MSAMRSARSAAIILALVRKEAADIFLSPVILFSTAFFALLASFAFAFGTIRGDAATAVFDNVVLFMIFASILLFPVVSMRSFAADNAAGTLETLLTAPISPFAAVFAKYAGAMVFVLVYLVHGVLYALLLSLGGRFDRYAALSALLALFAFGSLAMSLGVLISALTASPVTAAMGTGGILFVLSLFGGLAPYSGAVAGFLRSMSFLPHAKRWIAGRPDTPGLVYFVSATALFLFCAWLAVNSREAERPERSDAAHRRRTVTGFLVAAGFVLLLVQAAVLHIDGFWENDMPLGQNLSRVTRPLLLPLLFALGAFVWSGFTWRAARRAQRNDSPTRIQRYATITETQVMRAPRYYYEENRRARRRVALAVLAAFALAVGVNRLARYPFREFAETDALGFLSYLQARSWDVSEDGRNSLSPTTEGVLGALREQVRVYSFLSADTVSKGIPVAEETRRLLERYAEESDFVIASFADAIREPELAALLAEEVGVDPGKNLENTLIVEYRERRIFLSADSLVADAPGRLKAYDGEKRITGAILQITNPGAGTARGIRPRAWVDRRLQFTGPRLRAALWASLVGMPLVWALAGAAVWWLRREEDELWA